MKGFTIDVLDQLHAKIWIANTRASCKMLLSDISFRHLVHPSLVFLIPQSRRVMYNAKIQP
jgi:hypothetical protein